MNLENKIKQYYFGKENYLTQKTRGDFESRFAEINEGIEKLNKSRG